MMKKLVAVLFAAVVVATLISGCGNSEKKELERELQEEYGFSQEEAEEFSDFLLEMGEDEESGDIADESVTEEETPMVTYERSAEWDMLSLENQAFQIDDVVYMPGVTVAEIMDRLAGSLETYEYEYIPEKLVLGRKTESISIKKGENYWFGIQAWNPTDETMNLSDCIVSGISIYTDAKPYCRYIDGRSFSDITAMTYADVKSLTGLFEAPTYSISEDSLNGDTIRVWYTNDYPPCVNDTFLAGHLVMVSVSYGFDVDTNTGMVCDLVIGQYCECVSEDFWSE